MRWVLTYYAIVTLLCSGLILFMLVNARKETVEVLRLDEEARFYTTVRILVTAPFMLLLGW
jgi:hypothetical protein